MVTALLCFEKDVILLCRDVGDFVISRVYGLGWENLNVGALMNSSKL